MKTKWNGMKILWNAALVSCFLVSQAILAGEGGSSGVGGGGSSLASHFFGVAYKVYTSSWMVCSAREWRADFCFSLKPLSEALNRARVVPRDTVVGPDGKIREAGNDGKSEIELNVALYSALREAPDHAERIARLAIHEYLVVAGQETNDQYRVSDKLISALKNNYFDLESIVGDLPGVTPTPVLEVKPCSETKDLRSVPVGFKCQTTKQIVYERVFRYGMEEAWKGPDGLVWGEFIGNIDSFMAPTVCKARSFELPDVNAFERGHMNGFEEVLPDAGKAYWTASERRSVREYYFSGTRNWSTRSDDYLAVRCVTR